MPYSFRIDYVDDPGGDGEFYRLCVSGEDTALAILDVPRDAPPHEILAAAGRAVAPPTLTPLQQQIAAQLLADPPLGRQAIADALQVSRSAVDQVARLVQGPAQRGRPRKAPQAHD